MRTFAFPGGTLRFSSYPIESANLEPERDVESVFDVGCSLGYVLRHVETEVFPSAACLRGVDVDRYAVETGNNYLRSLGSKIELVAGDVSDSMRSWATGNTMWSCVAAY